VRGGKLVIVSLIGTSLRLKVTENKIQNIEQGTENNIEQGTRNNEQGSWKTAFRIFSAECCIYTSKFNIPCSLFNIL
jgi:hypothetical protein